MLINIYTITYYGNIEILQKIRSGTVEGEKFIDSLAFSILLAAYLIITLKHSWYSYHIE